MVNRSFEELADVAVDYSSWRVVHCFEGFRGDPVETRQLPFFSLLIAFARHRRNSVVINWLLSYAVKVINK